MAHLLFRFQGFGLRIQGLALRVLGGKTNRQENGLRILGSRA